MKRKRLKEDSELYRQIVEVEALMDKYGLSIDGSYLILTVNNKAFRVGENQEQFPRALDEPFVLIEE